MAISSIPFCRGTSTPWCSACGVIAPAAPMPAPAVSPWTGVLFLLEGGITAVVGDTSYDLDPGGLVVFPGRIGGTFTDTGEAARFLADRPASEFMAAVLSMTGRHGVAVAGV